MSKKKQIIISYVPVLHDGYRKFFYKYPKAAELYIIGPEIVAQYKHLVKDIRALDNNFLRKSILSWKRFKKVEIIGTKQLESIAKSAAEIVMPNEQVMRDLKEKYFAKNKVKFDSIFLFWDKHRAMENRPMETKDQTVSTNADDVKIMKMLKKEAAKSPDIWRHIGAAIVKDGKVVSKTYNHSVPSEHLPYQEGDPRSSLHKGDNVEISTAFHCEACLIAEAARKGTSLEGMSIYVTAFPCPPCAKLVAYSGIKKIYYADGYGVLDGVRVLKSQGVKIIFVKS